MTRQLVAYYRVSTERQGRSGLGLDAQRDAVLSFAKARDGEIIAEFTETESGRDDERPELRRAIAFARARRATLVVAKLDRLTRSARHLLKLLDESGTPINFCDLPDLATDDPITSRLLLTMLVAVAEWEARRIGQRTREALAARKKRRAKEGLPPDPPKGFCRADHPKHRYGIVQAVEVRRAKARPYRKSMRHLFQELERQGMLTLKQKADALNSQGFTTVTGKPWSPASVEKLLVPAEWE